MSSLEKSGEDRLGETDASPYGSEYIADPATESSITWKVDLHILPWIFLLWLLAFIDRSNIGNAKLDGVTDDLHRTGNKYSVALTVFYIVYVLIDIPSNRLLKSVGEGRYLPVLSIAWGVVGTSMDAVKS